MNTMQRLAFLSIPLALGACSGGGGGGNETGDLSVLLQAEDTITDGLAAGEATEDIRDGWTVTFDKYLAAVGHIDVHTPDESQDAEAEDVFVVDLTTLPEAGLELWSLTGLATGDWDFNYETPHTESTAMRHSSVSEDDFNTMVAEEWTYHIVGTMMNDSGVSCPPSDLATPGDLTPVSTDGPNPCYTATEVDFVLSADADTEFTECEVDEIRGFTITPNGTTSVGATIHGDHIFFNGFPEGDEGGVVRLAQWLADCDLNLDGTVTMEELGRIMIADIPEFDDRFQFGGSPIENLDTQSLAVYVQAQLKTQGHYQGEGECAVDGEAHDHD